MLSVLRKIKQGTVTLNFVGYFLSNQVITSTLHDVGQIHLSEPRFSTWDKKLWDGLPWLSRGWESTCQCRRHGFNPWSRRITPTTGRLGSYATTAELSHYRALMPQLLKPMHLGLVRLNRTCQCNEGKKKPQQISEMCRVWATCGGSHCKFLARGSRKMSCLEKIFRVVGALYLSVVCFPAASVIGDLVRCRLSSPVSDPLNQIPKWLACMLKFGNIGVKEAEGNPEGYWSIFGVKY